MDGGLESVEKLNIKKMSEGFVLYENLKVFTLGDLK